MNILDYLHYVPGHLSMKLVRGGFLYMNENNQKRMGFAKQGDYVDCDYEQLPCEWAEFSQVLRFEDHRLKINEECSTKIYHIKYSDNIRYVVLGSKRVIADPKDPLVKVRIFTGQILNNVLSTRVLKTLKEDLLIEHKKSNIYPIVGKSNTNDGLSKRELQCLYHMLRGKSTKEIGRCLQLSFRTIDTYIDRIKAKFFCETKGQVIENAFNKGYHLYMLDEIFD